MLVSLDGFIAGSDDDLSWFRADDEFNEFSLGEIKKFDTVILARHAYQLFEGYWPTAPADPSINKYDLEIAYIINDMEKLVFSRTLTEVGWRNSRLRREVDPDEINGIKQQTGRDMVIYGGAGLARSFMNLHLIDEFRLLVHPILLGEGKALFEGVKGPINLRCKEVRRFESGIVALYHEPA